MEMADNEYHEKMLRMSQQRAEQRELVSDSPDLGQADRPTLMSNTREWAEYADSLAAQLAQAERAMKKYVDLDRDWSAWNNIDGHAWTPIREFLAARLAQAEREEEEDS